jgi:excisionase family DNA binding protein
MEKMEEVLMTKKELSEYLNCSMGTIDNLMKEGRINYIKIGKMVRFDKEDIDKTIGILKMRGVRMVKNLELRKRLADG